MIPRPFSVRQLPDLEASNRKIRITVILISSLFFYNLLIVAYISCPDVQQITAACQAAHIDAFNGMGSVPLKLAAVNRYAFAVG